MLRELVSVIRPWNIGAAPATGSDGGARKKILVVDDDPETIQAIAAALAHSPFQWQTASTAAMAVRQLSYGHPDLILADSQLAGLDGTRLVRRLLADEALLAIPVVALVETRSTEYRRSRSDRVDGEIAKPVDVAALSRRLGAFLACQPPAPWRQNASRVPAGVAIAATRAHAAMLLNAIEAGLPDSQFAPGTLSSLAWLVESDGSLDDAELAQCLRRAARLTGAVTARARSRFQILIRYCRALMEREPDAAPGMAELRCAYLENRRAQFENLERSLENGDFRIISEAAHNMKGTGAAYGFAEITEIARAMESAAKRQDTDAVGHLLARLDCYVGGVTKPALAA